MFCYEGTNTGDFSVCCSNAPPAPSCAEGLVYAVGASDGSSDDVLEAAGKVAIQEALYDLAAIGMTVCVGPQCSGLCPAAAARRLLSQSSDLEADKLRALSAANSAQAVGYVVRELSYVVIAELEGKTIKSDNLFIHS
jgi:hypothetical protein